MSGRELTGFFELVQSVGCVRVSAPALTECASASALAALRAEGVLEDGRPAETLPCEEDELCDREVRDTWEGKKGPHDAARRYLAVCGRYQPHCDSEWVDESEVRTVHVRLEALQRMVMRLLAVRPGPSELPRARAWGERPEPRRIGTRGGHGGATRDVFLSLRPRNELTRSWLALRERGARGVLVIVPTMRRLEEEVVATCTPIDDVEILALDEALTVRDGVVAASAGLRTIAAVTASNDAAAPERAAKAKPKPARHQPLRKTRGSELPPIRTWRDLRVCLVDEKTVRFDGGGKYARFTALDLGLASRATHKPTRAWAVLAMTCDHGGLFTYTKFEKRFTVARKQVSLLGLKLQALFGIDEPPFQEPWGGVYRSKFIARVGVPGATEGESESVGEE